MPNKHYHIALLESQKQARASSPVAPTLLFMSAPQGVGPAPAHGVRQLHG